MNENVTRPTPTREEWYALIEVLVSQMAVIVALRGDLVSTHEAVVKLIKGDKAGALSSIEEILKVDRKEGLTTKSLALLETLVKRLP